MMHSIVAHAHLLHPVLARDLINQLAKKLVSSLAVSPMATQEAKSKIYYLNDDDYDNIFS